MDDKELLERDRWLDYVEEQCLNLKHVFPYLSRSRYIAGSGPEAVPMAFVVSGAPGAVEQAQNRPYCGRAGLMLRQLLRHAGLEPAQCWLTYGMKFRPPGNRLPKKEEIKAFRVLLQREWLAVGQPQLIITIGSAASHMVLMRESLPKAGARQVLKNGANVWPMTSPQAGFFDDKAKDIIEAQWETLKQWRETNDER